MYGCAYDEVPADEALDLVLTLPPGSLYVRSRHPEHAWPEWRHAVADLQDDLWAIAFAQAGVQSESPRTPRPADAAERRESLFRFNLVGNTRTAGLIQEPTLLAV